MLFSLGYSLHDAKTYLSACFQPKAGISAYADYIDPTD